ncbi:hypothetical protein Anapl_00302 [Anas platyrhynchos]|uniref:Uncharacterized protein n=1 Tax=Anas platyrhynchos TaxID=8839 RepID=R0KCH9_ANAPL|nr:hypothetical protein Anapl_00302 [Anas platyrhynchos]
MFLARAASLDRYNLQTYNGCIYCAYFGSTCTPQTTDNRHPTVLQSKLQTPDMPARKHQHHSAWSKAPECSQRDLRLLDAGRLQGYFLVILILNWLVADETVSVVAQEEQWRIHVQDGSG